MRKFTDIPAGTIHKAGEDYLESILVLHRQKGMVRSVDVAQFLGYSKPSVSNAVSVLQRAGYLFIDSDRFLHLTEEGQEIAERIYERHCFFRDFLTEIGVDPKIAEEDACRMEHVISQQSFECLKAMRKKDKLGE